MNLFDSIFDNVKSVQPGQLHGQLVRLLERTWLKIAQTFCLNALNQRMPECTISNHDIARLEIDADDVRCAVYSQMVIWEHVESVLLDEWFELTFELQDKLLQEAFPSNKVYGV